MASSKRLVRSGGYGQGANNVPLGGEAVARQRRESGRLLTSVVETEVIPRLLLARRAGSGAVPARDDGGSAPTPEEVEELVALAVAHDGERASAYVEAVRAARGASVETLYLDLLAPAARRLGELWTADLCTFADVTVALGRLQQVMRGLGPAFRGESGQRGHGRRALLAPVPGEQHTFGLVMVADFFSRAGWDVWSGPAASRAELVALVRADWFAVVGLSAGGDTHIAALAATIRAVRRASRNRAVGVLVGGPAFVARPELAALVGADATAADGRQAVLQAQSLLSLLSRSG